MIVCFQRSRFFGWKKCWVVLERGVLSYFNKRFAQFYNWLHHWKYRYSKPLGSREHYMTVYNSVYISPPVHTMHQLFFWSHYAEKLWKRNNHRTLWICVSGKLHLGNHILIVTPYFFEKLRVQNVLRSRVIENPAFSNSSCLKSVFENLCFLDGLVWTVGIIVEVKFCSGAKTARRPPI